MKKILALIGFVVLGNMVYAMELVAKIDYIRYSEASPIAYVQVSFYKDGEGWANMSYAPDKSVGAINAFKTIDLKKEMARVFAMPKKYSAFKQPRYLSNNLPIPSDELENLKAGDEIR